VSLGQIVALMRRHLVAVVAILVLTAGVAWHIKHTSPPYSESATVIFTPPAVNPYSSFSSYPSALLSTAEVMTETMLGAESQQKVREAGGIADVTIGLVNFNNEQFPYYGDPYVTVTATATDPATAHRTFEIVMLSFQRLVTERQVQAGAIPVSFITTHVVGDTGPVAEAGSQKRVFAGLIVLAIMITFLVLIFLDRHPIWPGNRRRLARHSLSSARFRVLRKQPSA
jgi:hypothetical protein